MSASIRCNPSHNPLYRPDTPILSGKRRYLVPIRPIIAASLLSLCCLQGLTACGGSSAGDPPIQPPASNVNPPEQGAPIPDNRKQSPMQILWFGNSHSHGHNLPALVSRLLKAGSGIEAHMVLAPGYWFLDERWQLAADHQLLQSRRWTALVLQAQKYSTTGQFFYSTEATQQWIALAKSLQVMPVLYPEHPRAGNVEEGERIYQLHLSIAAQAPACVAPVGPLWDQQRQQTPALRLHEADGNHFNMTGALLSAYLFYEVLSGQSAAAIPDLPDLPVPVVVQQQLRQNVAQVVARQPACRFF